jgi:hypothetical protein
VRWLFLGRFWPLLNRAIFLEAAGTVLKIVSSLKVNHITCESPIWAHLTWHGGQVFVYSQFLASDISDKKSWRLQKWSILTLKYSLWYIYKGWFIHNSSVIMQKSKLSTNIKYKEFQATLYGTLANRWILWLSSLSSFVWTLKCFNFFTSLLQKAQSYKTFLFRHIALSS